MINSAVTWKCEFWPVLETLKQTSIHSPSAAGLHGGPGAGSGKREIWGDVHSHGGYSRHCLQQCPRLWLQHRSWHCPQHYHLCQCSRYTHLLHVRNNQELNTHFVLFLFRRVTESNSLQQGPSAEFSSLRLWVDTVATWPPWLVWLLGLMLPTSLKKRSPLKTWRWSVQWWHVHRVYWVKSIIKLKRKSLMDVAQEPVLFFCSHYF